MVQINKSKLIFVFSDRDGTINKDEDYYLGSDPDWRSQISFLPGVVEGIKLINSIPNTKFIIVSNQSGVALDNKKFKELDEQRAEEVNKEIINRLKKLNARIDAAFMCFFITKEYAKKAISRKHKVNENYVKDMCTDIKPGIGMLEKAARKYGVKLKDVKHKFMIGDRWSDILTGLRADCISILIPSFKTSDKDIKKVSELKQKFQNKVYIVDDFYKAAELIKNNLSTTCI